MREINETHLESLSNFLKIYFNFAFILCFSPYRYILNTTSASVIKFTTQSWLPQRFACVISSILAGFWLLREIRLAIPTAEESRNPSQQFRVMLSLCGALTKAVTLKKLWFSHTQILKILNYILYPDPPYQLPVPPELPKTKTLSQRIFWLITKKWMVVAICAMYTGISLITFGMGRVLQNTRSLQNVTDTSNWWTRVVRTSQYNFFLTQPDHQSSEEFSSTETLLGALGAIGFFQRQVMGSFCDLFLLMGVLTFWTATKSFALLLKQTSNGSPEGSPDEDSLVNHSDILSHVQVISLSYKMRLFQAGVLPSPPLPVPTQKWYEIEKYLKSLQALASLINSLLGSNVTLYLIEGVVYYSTSLDQVFFEDGQFFQNGAWAKKLSLTFFFANVCIILLFSADTAQQMNSLKEWLSFDENRSQVPVDHLHVILNEVDSNVVALKGSGIFPVTYSLLANMLSIMVTYFIICVQA